MSGLLSGFRRGSGIPPSVSNHGGMEPIPEFPRDASYDTKLKQLNPGPTVSIHFGSGPARFSISQRLLIYHSPKVSHNLLVERRQTAITLREEDEEAFNYLHHFLTTGNLSIPLPDPGKLPHIDSPEAERLQQQVVEACTMLVRVHHLCTVLGITGPFRLTVDIQLQLATSLAEGLGMSTPLSGEVVMETYEAMVDRSEQTSDLWEFILNELGSAFSRSPSPHWDEYKECFLIPSLNKRVFEQMHGRIVNMMAEQCGGPVDSSAGENQVVDWQLPVLMDAARLAPVEEQQALGRHQARHEKRKRVEDTDAAEMSDATISIDTFRDSSKQSKKMKIGEENDGVGSDDTGGEEDAMIDGELLGHFETVNHHENMALQ